MNVAAKICNSSRTVSDSTNDTHKQDKMIVRDEPEILRNQSALMKIPAHRADVTNDVAEWVRAKVIGAITRANPLRMRMAAGCILSTRQTRAVKIDIVIMNARKFFEPKMPIKAYDFETPSYRYSPKMSDNVSETSVESISAERK
jgi:hypothetical protein